MATAPQIQTSIPVLRPKNKRLKRLLIAFLLSLLVLALASTGLSAYVGWKLTHPERKVLQETPAQEGLAYQDVEFPSRFDKVPLKGWQIPTQAAAKKHLTLVFAHGYRGIRTQPDVPAMAIAKALSAEGYDLLLFDFRDCGESGGSFTSVGQYETGDLLGAIDWARQSAWPGQPVGLLGFSMGASTSIMAAAADPSVVGVVADSPFSNLKSYLEANLSVWSHLPEFPFTPLILGIMPPVLHVDPAKVSPLTAVNAVYPRPILFIHSVADDTIPYTESEKMWSEHKDRFQFWKSDTGKHVGTYKTHPEEYISRVNAFFAGLI